MRGALIEVTMRFLVGMRIELDLTAIDGFGLAFAGVESPRRPRRVLNLGGGPEERES